MEPSTPNFPCTQFKCSEGQSPIGSFSHLVKKSVMSSAYSQISCESPTQSGSIWSENCEKLITSLIHFVHIFGLHVFPLHFLSISLHPSSILWKKVRNRDIPLSTAILFLSIHEQFRRFERIRSILHSILPYVRTDVKLSASDSFSPSFFSPFLLFSLPTLHGNKPQREVMGEDEDAFPLTIFCPCRPRVRLVWAYCSSVSYLLLIFIYCS